MEIGLSVDPEGSGGGRLRETRLWVAAAAAAAATAGGRSWRQRRCDKETLLLLWCLLELDRSGRSCYRCGFLQVWPAAVDGGDEVAGYVAAVAWRESGWKKREGMMAPV
jgi:hypothetical protein